MKKKKEPIQNFFVRTESCAGDLSDKVLHYALVVLKHEQAKREIKKFHNANKSK